MHHSRHHRVCVSVSVCVCVLVMIASNSSGLLYGQHAATCVRSCCRCRIFFNDGSGCEKPATAAAVAHLRCHKAAGRWWSRPGYCHHCPSRQQILPFGRAKKGKLKGNLSDLFLAKLNRDCKSRLQSFSCQLTWQHCLPLPWTKIHTVTHAC